MKNKTAFWDCDPDKEYLRHEDIDEAIEAHLDGLEVLPRKITAYGFSRKVVSKKHLVARMLEAAHEYLDEYYSGEDGHDINEEIKVACDKFADVYIENFTTWQCEESEKVEIDAMEWVSENRPDWHNYIQWEAK